MFERDLTELKRRGLLRQVISRQTPQGPEVRIGGRRVLNFSSNDYLGLANHPEVIIAASAAAKRYGFGSGASPLLGGGCALHRLLEEHVAAFKGAASALVFNTGFGANTGIIPAIAGPGAVIFSDEYNHASIIDGCRLSRARTIIYPHADVTALRSLLSRERGRRIVVTDSVFSMDGDIAPLGDIHELCVRYDALLYVDDAHATGVLGCGRGGFAHFGITPTERVLQMGTFSKALGSFGAYAAGTADMTVWLVNTARSFIFSTALPAPVVAASLKALSLVQRRPSLNRRLWHNQQRVVEGLRGMGYVSGEFPTPIIPIRTGSVKEALRLGEHLWEHRIYAPAVRPPTVKEARVRITVSAAHTERHIEKLLRALRSYRRK